MTRFTRVVPLVLVIAACSRPPAIPRQDPAVARQVRMAEADRQVRAGCLDCLIDAYHGYEAMVNDPGVADQATAAAIRSAALIAIRERELGIVDSGALLEARALAASMPAFSASFDPLFAIIETLGARGAAGNSPVMSDAQIAATAAATRNRAAWVDLLRARAGEDELTAYLSLAFNCSYSGPTRAEADALLDPLSAWTDTPLVSFRLATCAGFRMPQLNALIEDNPRFVEISYFAGLQAVIDGNLDEADAQFAKAYTWRPRWPAVASSRGNVFMTAEDFEQAADFYGRAVALVPDHPEALLGKARALTYGGRYADAIAAVDVLLAQDRWYLGDARYWRAMNELQLGRLDDAWDDIESAARLMTNAEVPKLAGIVALRRGQLPTAQAKFEQSRRRNGSDCETAFYLGSVLAGQRLWEPAVDVFIATLGCLDSSRSDLEAEIAALRSAATLNARQTRQVARREQQLAAEARMKATSLFNTAAALFNVSRHPEARGFAEQVADDAQFGDRARELLSRIADGAR